MNLRADELEFNRDIRRSLAKTVWQSGCKSWYQTEDGKNSSLWPGSTFTYWARTLNPNYRHYVFSDPR